jgi:hypothetical protein
MDEKLIAKLRRQREFYLDIIKDIHAGTYSVTRKEHGQVIDPDHTETLERMRRIVDELEALLASEGASDA